ncbi:hypothetical protein ANN_23580 [Periplaneta americana]|uniref:Uncharacterized protein n=1 Tax=Periplaneta americana TaxID=6978 RepID=A0ABQ8SMY1_PERAM|nr:hypothetical protein ANN_23580 [Periplaneta americana]
MPSTWARFEPATSITEGQCYTDYTTQADTRIDRGFGHLKSLVYETPIVSKEELVARVFAAADTLQHMPGVFECVRHGHAVAEFVLT